MKKIILLLITFTCFQVSAQTKEYYNNKPYYEGTVRVISQDDIYTRVISVKTGNDYIISNKDLVHGKMFYGKVYDVLADKVSPKGTHATLKLYYYHVNYAQNNRDMRKAKDSISFVLKVLQM